jgi:ABC-type transporter Mla subunit MlaD
MELLKKYKNAPSDQQNVCTHLKENQQYVERLTTLERLTSDLQQHKARRDQLKQLSGRLSSDARQFVSREAAALPAMAEDDFDTLAKKVGAANPDDLLNEIARCAETRKRNPKTFASQSGPIWR